MADESELWRLSFLKSQRAEVKESNQDESKSQDEKNQIDTKSAGTFGWREHEKALKCLNLAH